MRWRTLGWEKFGDGGGDRKYNEDVEAAYMNLATLKVLLLKIVEKQHY